MGKYSSPEAFRADCEKHFRYLITDYGCELLPQVFEFTATYRNATTVVSIEGAGYGFEIHVGFGRTERVRYEPERFSFDKLLLVRAPGLCLVGPGGIRTSNDQEVQLAHYARALREHGGDFLRGDFSVVVEMRKKSWPRKRAAKKKAKKKTKNKLGDKTT